MSASSWLLPSLTLGQSEVARSQGLSALSQLPQGSVLQCSGVSLLENRPGPLPTGTVSVRTSRGKSSKCVCVCVCVCALGHLNLCVKVCVAVSAWNFGGVGCSLWGPRVWLSICMLVNPPSKQKLQAQPLRW